MDAKKKALAKLLLAKSYKEGDFTLASGRKSDWYFDCRITALSAEGSWLIGNLFLSLFRENCPDIKGVAGMTMGADPLVSAIAFASFQNAAASDPFVLDGLLVRKEAKGHGTNQFVEGLANFRPGDKVAIVDDVITTGGSILKAWRRVLDAGLKPACMAAIIDREEGGTKTIAETCGMPLVSLFTRRSLLALGR